MRKSDVIQHFTTRKQHGVVRLAKLLKLSRQAIYQWAEDAIPEHQARRIAKLSGGALKVDEKVYAGVRRRVADLRRIAGAKRGRA